MSTGVVEKITNGSVILTNCFHLVAPSMLAASYRSVFILDKIPVASNIDVGILIQALTNRPISLALIPASISRNPTALPPADVI